MSEQRNYVPPHGGYPDVKLPIESVITGPRAIERAFDLARTFYERGQYVELFADPALNQVKLRRFR